MNMRHVSPSGEAAAHRRALTFVEMLLALALLSGLMLATASWTMSAARGVGSRAATAQWEQHAREALQVIHDLLAAGDFTGTQKQKDQPRVLIEDGRLMFQTRSAAPDVPGPVSASIGHAATEYKLMLTTTSADRSATESVLLSDVGGFECEVDEDKVLLTVRLVSVDGRNVAKRMYRIDAP